MELCHQWRNDDKRTYWAPFAFSEEKNGLKDGDFPNYTGKAKEADVRRLCLAEDGKIKFL